MLYVKEDLRASEFRLDDKCETLWVRIGSQKNASELYVGICYRSPSADDIDIKKMLEVLNGLSSKSVILMGGFNYGGIDWDNNLASNKKEKEFLDIVNDAF